MLRSIRCLILFGIALLVGGCGAGAATPTTKQPAAGATIAFLLPEKTAARYESDDRPFFEHRMKALCATCIVIYSNANQDAALQDQQAEEALNAGAQVIVLDPVDSVAAGKIADKAKQRGVPVIAYDRLILNSDGVSYYISFDNDRVGELQARSLLDRLIELEVANPRILMINGAPTDNNASQYKRGALAIFDPRIQSGVLTLRGQFDTPHWQPDEAQGYILSTLMPGETIDGIYAANDGTAGGVIEALKQLKIKPLPPVTGQDAELAAIKRIVLGEQYMTVYKAIKPQAEAAAEIAYALATKQPVSTSSTEKATANNGVIDVPAVLLTPVAVTKLNILDTVVRDGFLTIDEICAGEVLAACTAMGLQ